MSILNFTLRPNGAFMYEAVADYANFADKANVQSATAEIEKSYVPYFINVGTELAGYYERLKVIKNADYSSRSSEEQYIYLENIREFSQTIANDLQLIFAKYDGIYGTTHSSAYRMQAAFNNLKILINNKAEIKRAGYGNIRFNRTGLPVMRGFCRFPGLATVNITDGEMITIDTLCSLFRISEDDIGYYSCIDDLLSVCFMVDPDRAARLTKLDPYENSVDYIINSLTWENCEPISCESTNRTGNLFNFTSQMVRKIDKNVYDLHIALENGASSNDIMYNTMMQKVVASTCNLFYVNAIVIFMMVTDIDNYISEKLAYDEYVANIKTALSLK